MSVGITEAYCERSCANVRDAPPCVDVPIWPVIGGGGMVPAGPGFVGFRLSPVVLFRQSDMIFGEKGMRKKVLRVAVGANDETVVNQGRLIHWSRQEGLIPSSRGSLARSSTG
ncbi:hypothetical protein HanRHA438_Chr13g0588701 [Helianthus annuus]|nr:hypothetical protein HanRHA438_Chr13g0588701 [Helianthus annuus]